MHKKPSLARRLRYAFDNTLSHGPAALIAWLGLATLVLIGVAIGVDLLLGGTSEPAGLGPRQVAWSFVFQALVPNPPGSFEVPAQFLVVMLCLTVASLGLVSILIGLLSATIQSRVESLRRGRSQIIESDHTVVLGWTDQVFPIVSGLIVFNAHRRHITIAVLGDEDQVEMEDQIRYRVRPPRRVRVVCRHGSSTQHADLDLVSPQTSQAIIILPGVDPRYPDALTMKTILALTRARNRRPEPYRIIAVLRRERNMEIARQIGGDEVELVLSGDVIARIIAQTCRQRGLSIIYTELLDATGDEIYFHAEPMLVGRTFGEALCAYEDSAVLGIFTPDGQTLLNPPPETLIGDGDQMIAIAQDEDRLRPSGLAEVPVQDDAVVTGRASQRRPERTLMLGWNWRAPTIIRQLDAYVAPGSALTVVAQHATAEPEIAGLRPELRNLELRFQTGETASRAVLESLELATYDHVVLLSYADAMDVQGADALTLLTLLHLRAIAGAGAYSFSLTSEMLDERNRDLAESTRADDYIVSDQLISLMMIQISQNRAMNVVFKDLLDPAGAEIFLKPAHDYVKAGTPVTFYTVVEAACCRREVAIGYRLGALAADRDQSYGVILNPQTSCPVTFGPEDSIIVLAEE